MCCVMIGDNLLNHFPVKAGENDREWIVVCSQNPKVNLNSQGDRGELNLELGGLTVVRHTGYSYDGC